MKGNITDYTEKDYLNSQLGRSNLSYIISTAILAGLLVLGGNCVKNINREKDKFLESLYAAPKYEYVIRKGDTLNKLCSEASTPEQRDLCKNYLTQMYPEFNKNMPEGKIIYLPRIKGNVDVK